MRSSSWTITDEGLSFDLNLIKCWCLVKFLCLFVNAEEGLSGLSLMIYLSNCGDDWTENTEGLWSILVLNLFQHFPEAFAYLDGDPSWELIEEGSEKFSSLLKWNWLSSLQIELILEWSRRLSKASPPKVNAT